MAVLFRFDGRGLKKMMWTHAPAFKELRDEASGERATGNNDAPGDKHKHPKPHKK